MHHICTRPEEVQKDPAMSTLRLEPNVRPEIGAVHEEERNYLFP